MIYSFYYKLSKLKKIILTINFKTILLLTLVLFIFFSNDLISQTAKNQSDTLKQDKIDTLTFRSLSSITENQEIKEKHFEMKKSPLGAILRSLVLPGWGQIYVENYWKAPLFAAGCGLLVYFVLDNNSKYQTLQKQFDEIKATNPNSSELFILRSKKEFYRDNRDQSAFFLVAVYILAAIDSYVGAHLYDFNVDDNIALSLNHQNFPSITLKIKIK